MYLKTIDLLRVVSLVGAVAVVGAGVARAESGAHKTDGHGVAQPKGHVAGRASRVFEAVGHTAAPSGHGKSGGKQGHGSGWAYSGDAGPDHWGSLKPKFKACGIGTMQSPIDVRSSSTAAMTGIAFDYRIVPLTILNSGIFGRIRGGRAMSMIARRRGDPERGAIGPISTDHPASNSNA